MIYLSESWDTKGFLTAPQTPVRPWLGQHFLNFCRWVELRLRKIMSCRVSRAVPNLAHGPQLDTGSLKCEAEMPIRSQPPPVELWSLY